MHFQWLKDLAVSAHHFVLPQFLNQIIIKISCYFEAIDAEPALVLFEDVLEFNGRLVVKPEVVQH